MSRTPDMSFYGTVAAVIVTLYVALAIELRLLRRGSDQLGLPDDVTRGQAIFALATVLVPLLLSAAGLLAALQALYSGSTRALGLVSYIGAWAIIGLFMTASLDYLFRFMGSLVFPAPWRRPVAMGVGLALLCVGIVLMILGH